MELFKEINYGFEKDFRRALEKYPEDFVDFNTLVKYYIDLNSEHENSKFNKKSITIPVVFHIVYDREENNLRYEAIKKILNELNLFYSKFNINFKLATRTERGEVMKEFGVARHDWTNKSWKTNNGTAIAFYKNQGVGIPENNGTSLGQSYNINFLKTELGWNPKHYFNIYLVNVIKDAKYSHITNSVTAEISDELSSFGIVLPFYAFPIQDLNYLYLEQSEITQYEQEPIGAENGNYISIIHAVAVSFNLLSLFSSRYEKEEWLDSCEVKNLCTYDGNKFVGDGCNDTPHLMISEYLKFRNTNLVELKCEDEIIYDGSNLMAHPYFVDNEFGNNILLDFPNYSLTKDQINRIRVNFFLFVDKIPTLWNYLSQSIKADPVQGYDDSDTHSDKKGCTDPLAINYNPYAGIDDGSCKYIESEDYSDEDVVDDDPIIGDPCEEAFIDYAVAIPNFSKTLKTVYRSSVTSASESLIESFKNFLKIKQVINSIL